MKMKLIVAALILFIYKFGYLSAVKRPRTEGPLSEIVSRIYPQTTWFEIKKNCQKQASMKSEIQTFRKESEKLVYKELQKVKNALHKPIPDNDDDISHACEKNNEVTKMVEKGLGIMRHCTMDSTINEQNLGVAKYLFCAHIFWFVVDKSKKDIFGAD